jgi:plasmid stabilization system protein ParE
MTVIFAPQALEDFEAYLAFLEAERGEEVAARERLRVLRVLKHFAALPVTGRRVRLEGHPEPAYRWSLRPFVVYYDRMEGELHVLRLYHAARPPIER